LDGLEILDAMKAREPDLPVIIFSGHGNIDTAVAAISRGAVDFIEKPFETERLLHLVSKATENRAAEARERAAAPGFFERRGIHRQQFGDQPGACDAQARCQYRKPGTDHRTGRSRQGSGSAAAPWLEPARRPRFRQRQFGADTPERFEQELFGEEAEGSLVRPGLLEMADGGTLYLDEVADMPLSTQARILRVLTEQAFVRVGGHRQIRVDVRVVSSSSRNLEKEIAERRFREDLFYRLNVVPVSVPALAERREDIPVWSSISSPATPAEQGVPPPEIAGEAMTALQAYEWPGNVRQLRNVVERTVILTPRDKLAHIDAGMLPPEIHSGTSAGRFADVGYGGGAAARARESFEREYLKVQDSTLFGQYFEDRSLHRHGAVGAAPQAEATRHGRAP
jgi:two-component system nitrogen regulation response regulator NtrX